ncbi:pyruvate kinase [Hornefia butyriciproducens]|uniref:pyruvate kinase n=1 Tax=Hornefia butyriciproducens TaxID=2652293 RepID=UPI002A91ABC0|nr:pyruvate kinase [Hornefia butyriciproducens]MDY5422831.1 pyruvate kinase [Hornefia butyriciproducens]
MEVETDMRKTKIICTIGPASRSEDMMRRLLLAGMNVARMNFSHGSHEEHKENIDRFRRVRDELGIPAAVLLDTKGPEIRTGAFRNGEAVLQDGQEFTLTTKDVEGTEEISSVTYKDLAKDLNAGDTVLINDGMIMLRVKSTTDTDLVCEVVHGGKISDHKGINVPNVDISMEYLSDQDKSDLLFGIEQDVDYVAASFVRSADDARAIRAFLDDNGGERIKLIAKIESTQGVANFEDILQLVDGIMVARGDMGVEVPFELLPGIQKRFIRRCVQQGKIVITATQMLESMITSPVPTRAEINDVANAVFDGTSAVMLSGESAAGKYPEEAVAAMARIAEQAEEDARTVTSREKWLAMDSRDITNAVGHAACTLAEDISAKAILAITSSGYTANKISKFRPELPIIGCTPDEKVYHQMALFWGVEPLMANYREELGDLFGHCTRKAIRSECIREGDTVVCTAGVPVGVSGRTNAIRVVEATLE